MSVKKFRTSITKANDLNNGPLLPSFIDSIGKLSGYVLPTTQMFGMRPEREDTAMRSLAAPELAVATQTLRTGSQGPPR